ncbi:sigma-54 dependent transcriptional regulator [Eubacteriales bacterium OttesenSCG-928-K08]|nr:sigma-54 dependent transcriptional regulator [Eubacteriales bacterium OttesenSCG-928-K08]
MPNILIADDEALIRTALSRELIARGYTVDMADNGKTALEKILKQNYDLVILDNQMPQMKGLDVLRQMRLNKKQTKVIMLTAYGTIANAVEAMKLGAHDYTTKPFENEELLEKISLLLKQSEAVGRAPSTDATPVWQSAPFDELMQTANQIRDNPSTVLILGESGTGKGVLARYIHDTGIGAGKPFIHINCAVLPPNLIESELFGHVAGSFTGATREKKGKFEAAEDGTVFLDEISTLTPELQAKLLTVLQERTFEKVGSNSTQKFRARIIAATNQELMALVQRGAFREDLYYRLNVISLACPPLRKRKDDIEPLAKVFLERYNRRYHRNVTISLPETWALMKKYSWPGNVRELENFIERIVVMNICDERGVQEILHSFEPVDQHETAATSNLKDQEYTAICSALEKHNGHRGKTAAELGISLRALQYKLKKYNLRKEDT